MEDQDTGTFGMHRLEDKQFYLDLLRSYLDSANDAIFVLCDEMKFLVCNRIMQEWLGESEEELTRHNQRLPITRFFCQPNSEEQFAVHFQAALASRPARFECLIHPPKTQPRWVEISLNKAHIENGQMIIGVARDITEQREVRERAFRLSSAIEQTADTIIVTNREGVIEYVNAAFEKATGFTRQEVTGKKPNILKSGMLGPEFYKRLWDTVSRGEAFHDVFVNRRKDGTLYHEEKTITPLKDNQGEVTHFISTGKDITERIQYQERLHHMAHYDVLTGLPNRTLFMDRLSQALARARWHKRVVGVLFLDLDRFKVVNDTLGHDVGDRVLQTAAGRLQQCVRDGDTVARLGGDELAIVLEDVDKEQDITPIAEKIVASFTQPFNIDGRELFINTSVGISVHPDDGEDAKVLIKNADIAMYRAKEQGGGNFQFYSEKMAHQSSDRLLLESSMRRALERKEFLLHYQPQVDLRTGEVIGIEALVRWRHPDYGLVPPLNFIPLAEETGLIVPLSEWILREACAQNKTLQDSGLPPMRVAVNLSARNFRQPDMAEIVARILVETGLKPSYLTLELMESTLLQQTDSTLATMRQLQSLGTHIVIDDFGIGYSSLSYLKRLPIDGLKIDQSFVQDITTDPDDAAIVTAITTMAHSLGLKVVAEGVETQQQLEFLRAHDCDAMQGFYFSKPVPAELLGKLLQVFGIPVRAQQQG
jgi:diguanylate cyclase (GGDEF)-like protein/PAS domain S-box-containing protein